MLKYIKWELKSLLNSYKKVIFAILIIIGLMTVVPLEKSNFITNTLVLIFIITVVFLMTGTFLFGAKKVVDTFRKKTFMLESMISLPPHKILLAKYILAIILNIFCAILFSISVAVIFFRLTSFPTLMQGIKNIFNVSSLPNILKTLITMIVYSTSFTSLVTFSYVLSKSLFPKGKGSLFFGVMIWYLSTSLISYITETMDGRFSLDTLSIIVNSTHLVFAAIFYIFTVKLIENKLEIYN